jgi:hypothetical protein
MEQEETPILEMIKEEILFQMSHQNHLIEARLTSDLQDLLVSLQSKDHSLLLLKEYSIDKMELDEIVIYSIQFISFLTYL